MNTKLAIILGPYRNLSTLTAAVLALHPQVQVLNHAGEVLWSDEQLDIFKTRDQPTYERFMRAAWELSGAGQRGLRGGSILHSHAFDAEEIKALYHARYGDETRKQEAEWLILKESMRIQNRLMTTPDLLDQLCEQFPDIRFIMPLRDPLDCAISNARTSHVQTLNLVRGTPVESVLEAVLDAFAWTLARHAERPDRISVFTEHDAKADVLSRLASHLGIQAKSTWLADGEAAFTVRKREQPPELVAHARARILEKLAPWPEIAESLISRKPTRGTA